MIGLSEVFGTGREQTVRGGTSTDSGGWLIRVRWGSPYGVFVDVGGASVTVMSSTAVQWAEVRTGVDAYDTLLANASRTDCRR
jgi:hypothetical protein